MREARADDHWRRIYKRSYNTAITRVLFRRITGLGDGEVNFPGALTVICGANGAGKSTLLAALLGTLQSHKRVPRGIQSRLVDAEITIDARHDGQPASWAAGAVAGAETGATPDIPVVFLDPARQCSRLSRLLDSVTNFAEILEALTPHDMPQEERETVSYLVGKDYTSCQVFEIEEFDEEDAFPYFLVETSDGAYGSESMGLGEMALHLAAWHLGRVPDSSILLIEEPETHIAPRSQDALMNLLAEAAATRGLWIILTTHAPAIVRRVPAENIVMVSRGSAGLALITNPTSSQLNAVLGIRPRFGGVLLVEDKNSAALLGTVLDRYASDILRTHEIVEAGSAEHVYRALSTFPQTGGWLSVVGVLDGDQRGRENPPYWHLCYLPGSSGPEALIRDAAITAPDTVADQCRRVPEIVVAALGQIEGLDDHDWIAELANLLDMPTKRVVEALTECWLNTATGASDASRLAYDIRRAVNRLQDPEG